MVSKLIDIRRTFAGNEDLTDIPDGVIFNDDDDVGDTNIDITEAFARTTPVTAENLGFTKINNPVMMASESLTRENITSSLAHRTVINNGDPDIFENENYNEPGNGSGDSGVGVLPFATKTTRGVVIIGANIDVLNGVISLSPASATKLGLVKAGANITIDKDGTINGVNSYVHPSTHPASIIVQNANNRFVTDAQISTWNGKANTSGTYTGLVVGSANKLTTARNINLTGNVTGTCTFDGSNNVSITCTVVANSHNHLWANITDKPSSFAPSAHNQASNTITAMTGYVKASAYSAIAATDNLNVAIGKLEKALDGKANTSGTYTSIIAGQANQLTTARTFTFTGGATGSGSFNGTGNVSIALTVTNDSHTHDTRYYTESEVNSLLAKYLPLTGGTISGNLAVTGSMSFGRIVTTGTGNDYAAGGVEIRGNGTTNSVFPTLGFHQPNKYATSIQCRGAAQISFYAQGASAYATTFHATVNATGDVVGYYSDERMKKDFVPVTGAIDKMWKVSPYYYVQNEVAERLGYEHNEARQIGFIAQQMERIFPEVVKDAAINHLASTNEEVRKMIEEGGKIKTIKYERLVPVLWNAILELDEEVKKLKDELRNK